MADQPRDERLVGVYPDEETARAAADQARDAGARDVEIGAEEDRVSALRGEMREELEESWAGPSVAVYTKEMARSVARYTAIAAAIGAIVALPFAFFDIDGVDFGVRVLIALFAGVMAGGTIGFLVGGGFFDVRRKSRAPLAAEQGVVVGADPAAERPVAGRMAGEDPVRIDRLRRDRQPGGMVAREKRAHHGAESDRRNR